MKVILVNGSPREKGCTYTALCEVAGALEKNGIETRFFRWVQSRSPAASAAMSVLRTDAALWTIRSMNLLRKQKRRTVLCSARRCIMRRHRCHHLVSRPRILRKGNVFAGKPGAAVVSCRRGGAASAFDQLNKYFTINSMPVVSSQYWNQVHGNTPDEVRQDAEGLQTMRTLGSNMAWLLKCIQAGAAAGITFPEREPAMKTNFIR